MDPRGKVALVTGGGRRLGRAMCVALAEAGADVNGESIIIDGGEHFGHCRTRFGDS